MSRQIKVSVIVPVYNAEKYLKQCMDSILSQTLQEIEILCVDDGSADGSKQILEEYREKDSRVKVFCQANQYAGCARNTGLDHAQGKYVIFWDSDDYFRPYALEMMYDQAEKTDAQICVCAAFKYDDTLDLTYTDNLYLKKEYLPEKDVFNKQDIPEYIFNFTSNVPWNKLFLRSFIEKHKLRFQPLRRANDVYFVMMSLYLASRITTVPKRLIYYRTANEQSLTGRSFETRYCTVQAFTAVKNFIEEDGGFSDAIQKSFINKAAGPLITTLQMLNSMEEFKEVFLSYKEHDLSELGFGNRKESYYYNPYHYEFLNHLMKDSFEEFLFWYAVSSHASSTDWMTRCRAAMTERGRMETRLNEVVSSTSYRVGRTVTWLPRYMKEEKKKRRRNKI